MKKITFLFSIASSFAIFLGCQGQAIHNDASTTSLQKAAKPLESSEAEANLTQAQADLRSKIVKNVKYDLHITLTQETDTFAGLNTITFDANQIDQDLFLDFKNGAKISLLKINNQTMSTPSFANHRILLPKNLLKLGSNKVSVDYVQSFSHDGRGLHRFVDPEDKQVYLYSQFEAFDAHQMFPCFDQPDLKATLKLTVIAPKAWTVVSTTREVSRQQTGQSRTWDFPETPRLSTYLFSLHAGPYYKWESKAGNIPLRLFARKSLARYVTVKDWFTPTQEGLKFYGGYFAYPYPFKKYDQLIVPDFNAGAMENVAAVTFTEQVVRRGPVTRENREHLASIILHEMAHMWFGDLVTMQWWNGLWLNESFATFMSALSQHKATEFKESWVTFNGDEKSWAYREDQLVTTHPIDGEVLDTNSAFTNFDGITYGKGASVLKQLNYYLGENVFRDGVRYYFKTHAFSNTRLQDFIGALEHSSGKDLSGWSKSWLRESGLDSVHADYACAQGRISKFNLELRGPDGGTSPREHRTEVALYEASGSEIVPAQIVPVTYKGLSTSVTELVGKPCPILVYPNEQDQDYVKVQLDSQTLAALSEHFNEVGSAFTRTLLWPNLYQMVRDAELTPQAYLQIVEKNYLKENDLKTAEQMVSPLGSVFYYLPQATDQERQIRLKTIAKVEDLLWQKVQSAKAGSDWQKSSLQWFTDAVQTEKGASHLLDLLTEKTHLAGFTLDTDRKWTLLVRLSSLGIRGIEPLLANQQKQDQSERGIEMAMAADAAQPRLDVKQQWFYKVVDSHDMPFARERAALRGILPSWQDSLRAELSASFYKTLPGLVQTREAEFLSLYTRAFLPATCTAQSSKEIEAFLKLNESQFPPAVTKALKIGHQEDQRCVKIRSNAVVSKI
jgi:aminopeptidase N